MYVLFLNIDCIEQGGVQNIVSALRFAFSVRVIFVDGIYLNILE